MEYAEKTYPAGVLFKSAYDGENRISTGKFCRTNGGKTISTNGFWVYHEGKWAEIVGKPPVISDSDIDPLIEEAKRRYPAGTRFKSMVHEIVITSEGIFRRGKHHSYQIYSRSGHCVYKMVNGRRLCYLILKYAQQLVVYQ